MEGWLTIQMCTAGLEETVNVEKKEVGGGGGVWSL